MFKRAILQSGPGGFSPSYHHFSEERATKYGKLAAAELGCLKLTLAATAECLRDKNVSSIYSVEFANELMSHPSIDLNHSDQPYLTAEPLELVSNGQYHTDVDVLIGIITKLIIGKLLHKIYSRFCGG